MDNSKISVFFISDQFGSYSEVTVAKFKRIFKMPEVGIEPTRVLSPPDFESGASTSFTTPANKDK